MIKKIVIIIIVLLLGIYILYRVNKVNEIIENYDYVTLNNNQELIVYNEYKLSEFVSISNGKLISDLTINTDKLGEQNIEFIYIVKDKKYKAKVVLTVVDNIKPIILGGNSYTIKKGVDQDLKYAFFSADNYDKEPIREVIGEYNPNDTGNFNLVLKVTDSSGNENSKEFILRVVNNISPSKNIVTKTKYIDVINEYKNNDTKIGIDVSRWQETIDYDTLKNNGVEFVMIRVGFQEGFDGQEVLDKYFINNITNANRVGIPVGLYFYSYATNIKEAKSQALWIVDQIKNYQVDLPISFDWETWNKFSTLKLSLYDINEISKTFMQTINAKGYVGMNYSSKYYLENIWDIKEHPTWLAHYTKKTTYEKDYYLWQIANDGEIAGINGPVDINIMNKKSIWYQ